ncbi:MAG: hypothetical protein J0M33_23860 [Anaerolineae bacterium]|nr:hypothetical protein [Anaerolineae bacterium]
MEQRLYKQMSVLALPPRLAHKLDQELRTRVFTAEVSNLAYDVDFDTDPDKARLIFEGEASIPEWGSFMRQVYGLFTAPEVSEFAGLGATTGG